MPLFIYFGLLFSQLPSFTSINLILFVWCGLLWTSIDLNLRSQLVFFCLLTSWFYLNFHVKAEFSQNPLILPIFHFFPFIFLY